MILMKPIWIALGFVFTGIGALGIPLPILPTTPFLLLAAFCFAKGSKRVDAWFRGTRLYKNHLESFVTHRAMTLKTKFTILLSASVMLLFGFAMMTLKAMRTGNTVPNTIGRVVILCMIPLKYLYFFTKIKTISNEEAQRIKQEDEQSKKNSSEGTTLKEKIEA
ncbi:YbaN family protein [Treponema pectinovorum]|uniref:YbaN family protein n=1 Tax=Treponema pectinovorum TaxID=164 RepID=UPI001C9C754F|nr:YbaN family protein [Treponema pectinovorum]